MLHPAVVRSLLDEEAAVAREAHGQRLTSLQVIGTDVICAITGTTVGDVIIRFDGERYDSEPLGLSVIRADGTVAPAHEWPGNLVHGAAHPVAGRPFACIRGCGEYHTFPGHTNDPWDHHRAELRLTNLLDHVLKKAMP